MGASHFQVARIGQQRPIAAGDASPNRHPWTGRANPNVLLEALTCSETRIIFGGDRPERKLSFRSRGVRWDQG